MNDNLDLKSEVIAVPEKKFTDKSKYRLVLENFIQSDMKAAKIECETKARANNTASQLRDWLKRDEKIRIIRRGYDVYLQKT